jgi:hypothetical protein
MTFRRFLLLGALASCTLLATGADARAAYTYTAGPVTAGPPPAGITDSFTPVAGMVSTETPTLTSLVDFSFTAVGFPTGPQSVSWTETLVSTTGAMQQFSISGTISFLFGEPLFLPSSVTITPISGSGFTLVSTGNNLTNLFFAIVPGSLGAAIPEPASMVMMGTGLVGVLGLGLRRNRVKAKA